MTDILSFEENCDFAESVAGDLYWLKYVLRGGLSVGNVVPTRVGMGDSAFIFFSCSCSLCISYWLYGRLSSTKKIRLEFIITRSCWSWSYFYQLLPVQYSSVEPQCRQFEIFCSISFKQIQRCILSAEFIRVSYLNFTNTPKKTLCNPQLVPFIWYLLLFLSS